MAETAIDVTPETLPAERPTALPVESVNAETLLTTALQAGASVETLERLFALREKLNAERARSAFFAALSAFQSECPIVGKGKQADIGGKYGYKYAPLDQIVRQVSPILARHGLSYTFDTELTDTAMVCICTVHHLAGHQETSRFRVPIDKAARMNDAQKEASANTYGNRYAFRNALGILTGDEDDDAQSLNGDKPKTDFGTPQRASAAKVAPTHCRHGRRTEEFCSECRPAEREPGADDVPAVPADAISEPQTKRVYALIHTALKAIGKDTEPHVDAVLAELDRLTVEHTKRPTWKHIAKPDYERLCKAIEPIVARLKDKARFVPRRVR